MTTATDDFSLLSSCTSFFSFRKTMVYVLTAVDYSIQWQWQWCSCTDLHCFTAYLVYLKYFQWGCMLMGGGRVVVAGLGWWGGLGSWVSFYFDSPLCLLISDSSESNIAPPPSYLAVGSVALLVASRTNDRKVANFVGISRLWEATTAKGMKIDL